MDALDRPLTLRSGLEIPQRIAMAPLTNKQSQSDGTLSDIEHRWLERRARDGFRFISTCAAFVSGEGHAWDGQLGIATDAHVEGLARLAATLKGHGARAIVQLHHAGAKADQAPQKLSTADDAERGIRGATADDLARVTDDFVAAALRARAAGFDGVEVHGANGYLFTQFLAPEDNPRQDGWGGSLENRARLLRNTVRAVRDAVGQDFTVGVRLSPVDVWNRRGLLLADGIQVGRWMAEDGVDFVHLSLSKAAGPAPHEEDPQPVARAFRNALPSEVPVLAAGGIWTRADALAAVDAGVDVVVVGKAAIAHPDWPVASSRPDFDPVRPTWSPEHLQAADVGAPLLRYLQGFSGMVEGGRPGR